MRRSARIAYISTGVVAAVVFLLILWKVPQEQSRAYLAKFEADNVKELKPAEKIQLEKNAADIENSTRVTIAQIVGGLALLAGLYFTYQNVRTAQDNLRITEQGKLTERFSKAVELLGSDKLDIRLGGIYALERIARDSQKDHWTVMEVLTAFVRQISSTKLELGTAQNKIREDLQAVLTIIGRRKWSETETQLLNLRNVDLSCCNLRNANLANAVLDEACLVQTKLNDANLRCAKLGEATISRSDLNGADLRNTYLFKADLSGANIRKANLNRADLRYASLNRAKIYSATLFGADIRGISCDGISGLTLDQVLSTAQFDYDLLPDDLKEQYKEAQRLNRIKRKGGARIKEENKEE